jgi:hypothetical protein
MKHVHVGLLLSCWFVAAGCEQGTPASAGASDAEYDRQSKETARQLEVSAKQAEEYERQMKEMARHLEATTKQLEQAERQAARFDKLLERWERQADREDRLLDRREQAAPAPDAR